MVTLRTYALTIGLVMATIAPIAAKDIVVTLDQANALARQAFLEKNYKIANTLSYGVLQQRPDDATALILKAATDPRLGRPKAGRKAGARAFRLAKDPALKFEAAYYAASAAAASENYGMAKFWLRRAYQAAPTDAAKARTQKNFQAVRARDPLSVNLGFSVTPTSNVNGGSLDNTLTIDGVSAVGALSVSGQALSGTRISSYAILNYRLSETKTRKTTLGLTLFSNNYTLSGTSKARLQTEYDANVAAGRNPRLTKGSDFDVASAEVKLTHQIAPTNSFLPDTYSFALGAVSYSDKKLYTSSQVGISRGYVINPRNTVRFSLNQSWLNYGESAQNSRATKLTANHAHGFKSGDVLRSSLSYNTSSSDDTSKASDTIRADFRYTFGKAFGSAKMPVKVDLGLSVGQRTYDVYQIGLSLVPGGREDTFADASIGMNLPQVNLYGFSPRLTANYSRTKSNVSRFEQRDISLNLSIVSAF